MKINITNSLKLSSILGISFLLQNLLKFNIKSEVIRVVLTPFIHLNFEHLVVNLIALIIFDFIISDTMKKNRCNSEIKFRNYFLIFESGSIFVNLIKLIVEGTIQSIGSSSGIAAVFGYKSFVLLSNNKNIGIVFILLLSIYISMSGSLGGYQIDVTSHLTGFIFGICLRIIQCKIKYIK